MQWSSGRDGAPSAWENNVEGFVVPNLDLMMDAADAAGFLRVGVNVRFDAFVTERTYRHACEQYASEIAVDDAQIPARDNANAYGAASTPPTIDELAMRDCTAVCAHSHGLAQCRRFAREHGLKPVPAASNAAACRDLQDFQIALGPSICADIYGLHRVAPMWEISRALAPSSSRSPRAVRWWSGCESHVASRRLNSNRSSRSFRW